MRAFESTCRFLIVLLGLLAVPETLAYGQPPLPLQPERRRVGNSQVATPAVRHFDRGPLHEAFAEPVNLGGSRLRSSHGSRPIRFKQRPPSTGRIMTPPHGSPVTGVGMTPATALYGRAESGVSHR